MKSTTPSHVEMSYQCLCCVHVPCYQSNFDSSAALIANGIAFIHGGEGTQGVGLAWFVFYTVQTG